MRLLHATDVHTDLRKYEAIVKHANSNPVDAVLITGDLTDKDSETYQRVYTTAIRSTIEKHVSKDTLEILKNAEAAAQSVIPLINLMQRTGSKPENLESLVSKLNVDTKVKDKLIADAKNFNINLSSYEKLAKEFQSALEADSNAEKIEEESDKIFESYQKKEMKDVDTIFSKCKKPV